MTTSQPTSFLSEILSAAQIPIGKLAYFRARLSNRIHELVLAEFVRLEREGKINRAKLARRIGRKPEQVTRWLGASGNWTIETFSDLMLGMGYEPALSLTSLADTQAKSVTEEAPRTSASVVIEVPSGSLGIKGHPPATAADAALPSQKRALEEKESALALKQILMPTFQRETDYETREQLDQSALDKRFGSGQGTHPLGIAA